MRYLSRVTVLAAGLAASTTLIFAGAGAAGAAASPATSTSYVKNFSYQFASNYTDGSSTPFVVSNSPFGYSDASQSLGQDGVTLNASGSPNYASSAVIVALGTLSSLFGSNGNFVPPQVTGTSNLLYNLYFDTNGNGTYFGWGTHDPYVYTGMDGDNAACMGAANNTSDIADFTCFGGETSTSGGPVLTGQMTMENVLKSFEARTDGGPMDPEVWAWIGVQTTPDQVATVTSVDGTALVKAVQAPKAPKAPSVLKARAVCNGAAGRRHWLVRVVKGHRSRRFSYYVLRHVHGKLRYVFQGRKSVAPGSPAPVVTHNGTWLKVHYLNGYGKAENTYARPGTTHC